MGLSKLREERFSIPKQWRPDTSKFYHPLKRCLDVMVALLALIIFAPLFLLVAVCIKLEDPAGPILFKQLRVGENGRTFSMYKFRSMVHNAESLLDTLISFNEVSGAMFKMKEDPRITKVGYWIRKTSLDEFPQLINVLKGEMSLVGPRPPLPREVIIYTDHDIQRLLVRPGCTGIWQVSGRSNLSFEEMVKLDLHYIENRSILLDFKLIMKTFFVLFGSRDAF
ncbi:sugar transferase [Bacillus sp. es.036]|uniref:sugar transferase n=1 Tax=Bacillus sp. es.036 TaxID=1761764 RepID=UPI000BF41965|nr:sugar transferase [Bacillus sp. es.036]PFG15037.1 lipopolysaccharide/colanic/teichoic acid biosynthesis glycosyltransferase [Bacillus sp. es.036]